MEIKRISKTDIDNIDKLFKQEGLISKCRKMEKWEKEEYEYICNVYLEDDEKETLSNITFNIKAFNNIKYMYIETLWNNYDYQLENYKSHKQSHIYKIGVLILFKAIIQGKKLGAKYVKLSVFDDGTNKLFKYYKQLGFKCYKSPMSIRLDDKYIIDYPKIDTYKEWKDNCTYMISKIDDILNNCCNAIEYKN